ncbi:MAG: UDP-N-acetylmuramoyl-L-alanyl-D-glutamate--2,6-diaminopimelate ligase [Magnetococcales bacterium]|nr:UDP-N-acetylmuramoyl-L-alanyl-D-glutamate--2,6-diaminopimelate ligase [Magnetococcales bacterium]
MTTPPNRSCRSLAAPIAGLLHQGPDPLLTGLGADSRQVRPGYLFAALAGSRADGQAFVSQALERGAVAVLHDGTLPREMLPDRVASLIHPQPRLALALLAAAFFGHPGARLLATAITGTNGKTTVTAMVAALLTAAGRRVGVVGTTGNRWPGVERPGTMTTPDPVALQALLADMVADGCDALAMEASSHALDQFRVAGIPFRAGTFLNLTRDHLDYHLTEDRYFEAKARLFTPLQCARGVIALDDPRGAALRDLCRERGLPCTTWSVDPPRGAAFCATDVRLDWSGSRFTLVTPRGRLAIAIGMPGRFNVANAVAASATAHVLGLGEDILMTGWAGLAPPPGRMEAVVRGQPFPVVVDYAHTPDALARLLATARELTPGRIICLFGCGGDRDRDKRPQMGNVATRLADLVVITDDNPRSEDPAAIRQAILAGMTPSDTEVLEIADREAAIHRAIHQARPGDVVLLAGKGHEQVQIRDGQSLPFDDREVASAALARLGFRDHRDPIDRR